MSQIKFGRLRFKDRAFYELVSNAEARRMVDAKAEELARAAGEGFTAHEAPSTTRARRTVYADDDESQIRENRNSILLRAVGQVKR